MNHKILVLGAGTGGIATAKHLVRRGIQAADIAIVDASSKHFYQPGFTKYSAGLLPWSRVEHDSAELTKDFKRYTSWAEGIDTEQNVVTTNKGEELSYDVLVVAAGVQTKFDSVPGVEKAVFDPNSNVLSNYNPVTVKKTLPALKRFTGGKAVFTFAPHKCPGAPQKAMYLADSLWRKRGVRDQASIDWYSPIPRIFGVAKYADALDKVVKAKDINTHFQHTLVELQSEHNRAIFKNQDGELVEQDYDLIHVIPGLAPPDFVRDSTLSDDSGFLSINKYTMQSTVADNVFGLGDCINIPSTKTAAAVAAQTGVVSDNIWALLHGRPLPSKYTSYTSCPLFVGDEKLILAEFTGFDGAPRETFFFDQAEPRKDMYYLTKNMDVLYKNFLLEGLWEGPERSMIGPLSPRNILNPMDKQ